MGSITEIFTQYLPDDLQPLISELKEMKSPAGYKGPEWKGYRFPLQFDSATAKKVYEDFEFEENTVILATFPKTGTTWIAEVIRHIFFGHDEKLLKIAKNVPNLISFLETWKPEKIELLKHVALPRRFYTTHLPEELVNFEKVKKSKSKVIVLVRNPKDAAVSWYHFAQGPPCQPIRGHLSSEWKQFYSDYIEGKQPIPVTKPGQGYAEFLLGWHKRKNESNVLFVHYEKMKANPREEIHRIAKFLDTDLTEEQISTIAEETSFSAMKRVQEESDEGYAKARKRMNLLRKEPT